ncbi:MAG TPA: ferredoxin [Planctomycetaceae bacterium]|nr:ferredoxin [Planctomycetaceae bacterium]HCD01723.1 ferredoxin [Planctomycetaceae bacterium]
MSERIDSEAVERRRARLTRIFADIVQHAQVQCLSRCPYRDRRDLCTAQFGCRNQGPVDPQYGLSSCLCDGELDYRGAWEVEDPEAVLAQWRAETERTTPSSTNSESRVEDTLRPGAVKCSGQVGSTLFDVADDHDVRVDSSCGRMGSCHECVIEVLEGGELLSERGEEEQFLDEGFRLACQAQVGRVGAVTFAPLRRTPHVLTRRAATHVDACPSVTRKGEEVLRGGEAIDQWRGRLVGLAVDVGTTTVAAELIDLETSESLCCGGFENPQRFGGSDVISRVSYDSQHEGEMHQAIIKALNNEILSMCQHAGVSRHTVYEVLVVGNSTMRDLVFGLDVQTIGQRPYRSMTEHECLAGDRSSTALEVGTRKLGIVASAHGRVVSPPLVGSHVGADITAGLLACDFDREVETRVFLDIGTNTEVVIGTRERIVAASCPAGPAFEGGLVQYGLPACDGAIDTLKAVGSGFQYTTLADAEPVGICGSGLVDLLSELKRTGQMTEMGVFTSGDGRSREVAVVDEPSITLSRLDASHLAQAKAASFCGQFILLRMLGIVPGGVQRVELAGGFAESIDIRAAVSVGFLAPFDPERVRRVGNAALEGARQLLLDVRRRDRAERLVERIEHIELETTEDFFEVFTEACQFKPMQL